jgi:hypothetical protein
MDKWSSYMSMTLFLVMPAGSGVTVVNVAVLGIVSVSKAVPILELSFRKLASLAKGLCVYTRV